MASTADAAEESALEREGSGSSDALEARKAQKERPPRSSSPWRDHVEALSMAVIMALFLKYFVVEAYKIPSGSMQPTLIGDKEAQVFDRILVDKLSFKFRDPKRFEVVVFKYPLDQSKSFVKRLVGIGPEDFRISQGDLWHRKDASEPWTILRRPRSVQQETWKRLDRIEPETSRWMPEPGAEGWVAAGREIHARGAGRAQFGSRQSIMDSYLDGYPDPLLDRIQPKMGTGVQPVGDLRVDCEVEVGPDVESIGIVLQEGPRRFSFRFPGPAAPAGAKPVIENKRQGFDGAEDVELEEAPAELRLAAGTRYRIAGQNLDDRLELELDGEVLCAMEIPSASQASGAYVFLEGGASASAAFRDLMAYRDIYYHAIEREEYSIPAGHYFMLGDNTQDSSDSREWKLARLQVPAGDDGMPLPPGEARERGEQATGRALLLGNSRRDPDPWNKNPARVGVGELEGPWTRFRDVHGEVWWLDGQSIPYAVPSTESAPFVPRRMIQGRALAVFWPLSPRLGLYRWKWIH